LINSFLAALICFFSNAIAAAFSFAFSSSALITLISSSCFLSDNITSSISRGS